MEQESGCIIKEIKRYAKVQLCSIETLETVVMVVLTTFMLVAVLPMASGSGFTVAMVLTVFFAAVTAFGLYETLLALLRYLVPCQADFLRDQGDEWQAYVKAADIEIRKGLCFDNCDLGATDHFLILKGVRTYAVLPKKQVASVSRRIYSHRKKYRGKYFLYFNMASGKRYTLDLHNGQAYNPEGQSRDIADYLRTDMGLIVE